MTSHFNKKSADIWRKIGGRNWRIFGGYLADGRVEKASADMVPLKGGVGGSVPPMPKSHLADVGGNGPCHAKRPFADAGAVGGPLWGAQEASQ